MTNLFSALITFVFTKELYGGTDPYGNGVMRLGQTNERMTGETMYTEELHDTIEEAVYKGKDTGKAKDHQRPETSGVIDIRVERANTSELKKSPMWMDWRIICYDNLYLLVFNHSYV